MNNTIRWNITVSKDTDQALRMFLANQGGVMSPRKNGHSTKRLFSLQNIQGLSFIKPNYQVNVVNVRINR